MSTITLDAARRFVDALPHSRALGMRLVAVEEGRADVHMDWDARLVGDPVTGVIHGGAVSALMDTCAGTAVLTAGTGAVATATLDLRIDYMRPATPGQTIRATAHVYHATRSVAFVRATATDDDDSLPVAAATGAFTLERPSAKAGSGA